MIIIRIERKCVFLFYRTETLIVLDISSCEITAKDAAYLSEALKINNVRFEFIIFVIDSNIREYSIEIEEFQLFIEFYSTWRSTTYSWSIEN